MTECMPAVSERQTEGGIAIAREENVEQVIARRRAGVITRAGYRSLLVRLLFLAAVFYLLFTYCFLITQCQGQGMYPALKDGDLCVVFRKEARDLFGEWTAADDVIAYRTDGKRAFGRVVAVAGDVVMLSDSGSLMVNGVTEGGEIVFPTYAQGELAYPYRVPEGCVFVLGDYRTNTTDSRDLGAIEIESVEGKLITILRRREL